MLLTPTTPEGLLPLAIAAIRKAYPGFDRDEAHSAGGLAVAEVCLAHPPEARSRVIRTVAKRRAIDVWRTETGRERQKPKLVPLERLNPDDGPEEEVQVRDTVEDFTERVIERLDNERAAQKLWARLSEDERFVIGHLADGMTLAQVGALLGVSEAAICVRRRRIRHRFLDPR